jgi:hypothetical protein
VELVGGSESVVRFLSPGVQVGDRVDCAPQAGQLTCVKSQ